ncbi:MAG: MFS transporter, partial [Planctomycetota bacterium]
AAALNKLSHYPDNANITLDYNFAIRAVIAIAPCDGQYKPAGHPTTLENINYLVIHGGHDADANIFFGVRQFKRVRFTDEHFRFKSAIYIYRANHSRFNTSWGRLDFPAPGSWLINEHPIMDMEDQRKVAKVLISAFLEASLNGRDEYLPVFKDTRRAGGWLPEDIYVNQYQDSNFQVIADFEEDFDVTTTTIRGGESMGENLTNWRETQVNFRNKGKASQDNSVVMLYGEKKYEDSNDPNSLKIGTYQITLDPDTRRGLQVDDDSKLVLSIGSVNPHQDKLIELTIELSDSDGNRAALPLSTVGPVHPALNVRLAKWKWLEKKFIEDFSERLLQTYEIPFRQFVESNSSFNPSKLENIRFVFDRFPNGPIMLDDIGISK